MYRVTEELARFQIARACRPLPIARASPRHNPTVPTAQPTSFPSVSSIEQDSPQNFDSYRQMQEEVLGMQLHALQQKQRAARIRPFYSEFKGKPSDLIFFP